ncbi:MAG: DNA polymerase I [Planctomycetes bacterium]|nr:DNA polymerase I [Planctomycetota bacterium]
MGETLYVIDGHAQIFRAYYAIRGGLNSPVTGEPTQAVFGFASMLLKLLSVSHPTHVVMAVDSPGKTFREEIYEPYKANRETTPPDLISQVPRIIELTKHFGIPVLGRVGDEADDIIATVTRVALADPAFPDLRLRIVSKDKDLMQLLTERVTLFDIHTDETIDAAWLKANRGVEPSQVIDFLTLTGDTADNIPGVPGIGPKTAAELLTQYRSIEGIYEHIEEIKGKRRENLEQSREKIKLARRLVTLKDDLDYRFTVAGARLGKINAVAVRDMFNQLGFRRLIGDLDRVLGDSAPASISPAAAPAKPAPAAPKSEDGFAGSLFDMGEPETANPAEQSVHAEPAVPEGVTTAAQFDYTAMTDEKSLRQLVDDLRKQPLVSLDTETIGLGGDAALCGLSLAWKAGHGVYIPLRTPTPDRHLSPEKALPILAPLFSDPGVPKCGHNLKYDALVLRHAGVHMRGIAFDSMIASHLLGSPSHGLDALALNELKHQTIPISRLIGDTGGKSSGERTMDQVPMELITTYAAEDADVALRLAELMRPRLKLAGMDRLADEVEMPLVGVLAEMEFNGIRVDPDELRRQQSTLTDRIVELRAKVQEAAGMDFNPDSPKQLADVLFRKLGLPVVKKTKTGPSTDIEVLETLADMDNLTDEQAAVPNLIVEYRQLSKLVGTYLENLRESINPRTGRVHTSFQQAATATGRLSSNNPNLQNIPIRTEVGRQIRKAFIADPGNHLVSADYSQIELRILAHLSGDEKLIEAFASGRDIHNEVASQVFNVPLDLVSKPQRDQAKVVNFGIIYGVSAFGLARRIEGLDRGGAGKLIADYKARYRGIDDFLSRCIEQAKSLGYVTTMFGRRRQIPEIQSRNPNTRSLGERLAINSVVQGSAAELIKLAMVNLHRRILDASLPMRLLLQIHDELVLECPAGEAVRCAEVVKTEMSKAMTLLVPLVVETGSGTDWFSCK